MGNLAGSPLPLPSVLQCPALLLLASPHQVMPHFLLDDGLATVIGTGVASIQKAEMEFSLHNFSLASTSFTTHSQALPQWWGRSVKTAISPCRDCTVR